MKCQFMILLLAWFHLLCSTDSACVFSSSEFDALQSLYTTCNGVNWRWNDTIREQYENATDLYPYTIPFEDIAAELKIEYPGFISEFELEEYDGIHWNFTGNQNPCTDNWKGIICNHTSDINYLSSSNDSCYITSLFLPYNNVSCVSPQEFGDFTYLSELYLLANVIQGTIPSSLEKLSELKLLNLVGNYLTSSISRNLLSLKALEFAFLAFNLISSIEPKSFGTSNIRVFDASENQIKVFLPDLFIEPIEIPSLEALNLDANHLIYGNIPTNLCNFKNMEILSLSFNALQGSLPSCLSQLNKLKLINLMLNTLSGSFDSVEFNKLDSLQVLALASNKLTGTLPLTLFSNSNLQAFYVQFNMLKGNIPPVYSRLKVLDISLNKISGSIPLTIYNATDMTFLNLNGNPLNGTISNDIGNLQRLKILAISLVGLTGTIPSSIGMLTDLVSLYLSESRYHGTIPQSFSNLKFLSHIYLSGNLFTGTLPGIENFSFLRELFLSDNYFTYTLPKSLANWKNLFLLSAYNCNLFGSFSPLTDLHKLEELAIGANYMTGTIPNNVAESLSRLLSFDISENCFTGTLPLDLGHFNATTEFLIYENRFSGPITNLKWMSAFLESVQIQNNLLSGNLDSFFESLSKSSIFMTYLDVSLNKLSGTIPPSIGKLNFLSEVHMSSNCFHGTLPETICNMTSLQVLSLNGLTSANFCHSRVLSGPVGDSLLKTYFINYIQGSLPECVWTLPFLRNLSIAGNGIKGTIPDVFMNISLLESISLAYNRLSGPVPTSLQLYQNILYLDLSNNQMRGSISKIGSNSWFESQGENGNLTLRLSSNRLSGHVPDNIKYIKNIDILDSNVFDCKSSLPVNDPDYSVYICGSKDFNDSMITFAIVFLVILVTCSILHYARTLNLEKDMSFQLFKKAVKMYKNVLKYRNTTFHFISENPKSELSLFLISLQVLRKDMCVIVSIIVVIGCAVYPNLSYYYGTLDNKYSWTVSSAFLAGDVSAVVVLAFYAVVFLTLSRRFISHREAARGISSDMLTEEERFHPVSNSKLKAENGLSPIYPSLSSADFSSKDNTSVDDENISLSQSSTDERYKTNNQSTHNSLTKHSLSTRCTGLASRLTMTSGHKIYRRIQTALLFLILALFDIAIVGGFNIFYSIVYISSFQPYEIALTGLLLSLFQFMWAVAVVPNLLLSVTSDAPYRPQRLCYFNTILNILNTIILPCIASMISLDYCFKSIFISAKPLTFTYYWNVFNIFQVLDIHLIENTTVSQKITFLPPFIYSGQCSTGILVAYIPILIVIYIFHIAVLPALYCMLCLTKFNSYPEWMHGILPAIIWPDVKLLRFGFPVKTGNVTASIMLDFGVILTFGVACPPLAFVVCIGSLVNIFTKEVLIGRYIFICSKNNDYVPVVVTTPISKRIARAIIPSMPSSGTRLWSTVEKRFESFGVSMTSEHISSINRQNSDDVSNSITTFSANDSTLEQISLKYTPLDSLDMSSRGMWRSPTACLSVLYFLSASFLMLVSIDIGGNQSGYYTSPALISSTIGIYVVIPLVLYASVKAPSMSMINPRNMPEAKPDKVNLARPSERLSTMGKLYEGSVKIFGSTVKLQPVQKSSNSEIAITNPINIFLSEASSTNDSL